MCTYASVVISRTILLLISPLLSRVLSDINWSALNWQKHLTLLTTLFYSRNGRFMALATQFSNGFIFTYQIGGSVWELTDTHPLFCPSIKVSPQGTIIGPLLYTQNITLLNMKIPNSRSLSDNKPVFPFRSRHPIFPNTLTKFFS